jgi:hypothetical protein
MVQKEVDKLTSSSTAFFRSILFVPLLSLGGSLILCKPSAHVWTYDNIFAFFRKNPSSLEGICIG